MSWDAVLSDDRGHVEGDWNYTHNCNGMANVTLDESGYERPADTQECYALPKTPDGKLTHYPNGLGNLSWWKCLDGMSGPEGGALLDRIVRGLEADPERFRAMNPKNGWGDYGTFVKVLTEMRDAVPEWPTEWSVHG